MAGRGRGMTLPAWMKDQNVLAAAQQQAARAPAVKPLPMTHAAPGQFEDAKSATKPLSQSAPAPVAAPPSAPAPVSVPPSAPAPRSGASERDSGRRDRDRDRSRDRSHRDRSHRSSRHKSSRKRRSRSRSKNRDRDRERRSSRSKSGEPRRRRRNRKVKNFDVYPPGVTEENAAEYAAQVILQANMAALSGAVGPASFGPPQGLEATTPQQSAYIQQTRHARRIYVGGIGDVNEADLTVFFNDVIDRALGTPQEGGAVVSVYINRERFFAFVELKTIELTTACMNLDGISFNGNPLKIRRPNDYNPSLVPSNLGPIPDLNLSALGIVGTNVPDGPCKIFVGGLPYHLGEEQVKELLNAFGTLKAFHLVKEPGSNLSKGYAFCEYQDIDTTDKACEGLNNLPIGDKTLTVRRAQAGGGDRQGGNGSSALGLDPSKAAMEAMSMAGITGPAPILSTPTRILVLKNMVTTEELADDDEYDDIVDDIKSECEKYGQVQSISVPRPGDVNKTAVGKVFVEFGDVAMARKAAADLHGRGFASRIVEADYFTEEQYASKELS